MQTNENGITLLSLVITVIVLVILAGLLVEISLQDNGIVNAVKNGQNQYFEQKEQTDKRVNDMTNGWENILR